MPRRTRLFGCIWIAVVLATIFVYVFLDPIACPDGYGDPTATRARVGGKFRIQLTCHAGGASAEGSMALVILAWVGLAIGTSVASFKLLNKLKPLEAAPSSASAPPAPATPTDKRDRRRERNQARKS